MRSGKELSRSRRGQVAAVAARAALAIAASTAALGTAASVATRPQRVTDHYFVENARVVATDEGRVIDAQSLLVEDGRIVWIGSSSERTAPPDVTRIDAAGRYVVPGLINSHVHLRNKEDLDQFLTFGVTTVREMFGTERNLRWRDAVRAGVIRGPEIVQASPPIYAGSSSSPDYLHVVSPSQGREVVRSVAAQGYDLVKVVRLTDPAALVAVTDEARKHGLSVAGHLPDDAMALEDLRESGMASIEHLEELFEVHPATPERIAAIVDALAASTITVTPMLAQLEAMNEVLANPAGYLTDQRLAKLDRYWGVYGPMRLQRTIDRAAALDEEDRLAARVDLAPLLTTIRQLHAAGVPLAVGTEGKNFDWIAGEGIHRELALFLRAGLSNHAALRAVTLDAARLLGIDDRKGEIALGKEADFIMVDDNPLDSLDALRAPSGIMRAGVFFDRESLSALRAAS